MTLFAASQGLCSGRRSWRLDVYSDQLTPGRGAEVMEMQGPASRGASRRAIGIRRQALLHLPVYADPPLLLPNSSWADRAGSTNGNDGGEQDSRTLASFAAETGK